MNQKKYRMTLYVYDTSVITCVEADNSPIDTDNIENITYVLTIEKNRSLARKTYTFLTNASLIKIYVYIVWRVYRM